MQHTEYSLQEGHPCLEASMEDWTKAKIAWVLCCLVGIWYRGGQEPVQAYIFTVAFIFLTFWMYILEDHYS
jgi:hypothetical protein